MKKHKHLFETKFARVQASYHKGARGEFTCLGDYQECVECGEGRFYPYQMDYQIVPCDYTPAEFKAKKKF